MNCVKLSLKNTWESSMKSKFCWMSYLLKVAAVCLSSGNKFQDIEFNRANLFSLGAIALPANSFE